MLLSVAGTTYDINLHVLKGILLQSACNSALVLSSTACPVSLPCVHVSTPPDRCSAMAVLCCSQAVGRAAGPAATCCPASCSAGQCIMSLSCGPAQRYLKETQQQQQQQQQQQCNASISQVADRPAALHCSHTPICRQTNGHSSSMPQTHQ